MASTFTFNLQRRELFSLSFSGCKCFSTLKNPLSLTHFSSSCAFAFSSSRHSPQPKFSLVFLVKPRLTVLNPVNSRRSARSSTNSSTESIDFWNSSENLGSGYASSVSNKDRVVSKLVKGKDSNLVVEEKIGKGFVNDGQRSDKGSGFSSYRLSEKRAERKMGEMTIYDNGHTRKGLKTQNRGIKGSGFSSKRPEDASSVTVVNEDVHRQSIKDHINNPKSEIIVKRKKEKLSKKSKGNSPEFQLRVGLDRCSKMGDVMGAISLYDMAIEQGVKMGQYHYTVLLYLCSSAAMGVIRPAKSGSGSRSLDMVTSQTLDRSNDDDHDGDDDGDDDMEDGALDMKDQTQKPEMEEIKLSDEVKKYALERGFEIYEKMCLDKVQMNEAALTSIARMAMAMGNGDMAFDMVKQMKELGINPKLRSYGPALSAFSSSREIDKAFAVEEHMLENGVHPEEPELEALLRVSIQTGKADRVYYLLHKLRTTVRSVSHYTADLIENWFKSKEAFRVGKRRWDLSMIAKKMENVGGGWHGVGWLGRGKWTVSRASVGDDGSCKCCGEKLALIDLDPEETERFAESVASLAIKREKNSSFQKFQSWLDYYGPFEAVLDAANVGLFSQRKFKPSKVNVVVNGIRQMLPSRKWPLIVLHNKRLTGNQMDQPVNKALFERWRNADALYATPTGSNDDWYWLYAAIKFKCLIVTNDEMRDHTFQLLGKDFFPKWKERHQVRFSFSEVGPVFHMPPPCSVVIQESERGHWHIPIASEHQAAGDRIWLCITRSNSLVVQQGPIVGENSAADTKGNAKDGKKRGDRSSRSQSQDKSKTVSHSKQKTGELVSEPHRDLRDTLSESRSGNSDDDHMPIWDAINAAEKLGGCVIDFHI